jgi:hypothetical protein
MGASGVSLTPESCNKTGPARRQALGVARGVRLHRLVIPSAYTRVRLSPMAREWMQRRARAAPIERQVELQHIHQAVRREKTARREGAAPDQRLDVSCAKPRIAAMRGA